MRKCFILLLFWSVCFATPMQERNIDPSALSELTLKWGISPDEELVAATQRLWLRKPGKERWEVEEVSPEQRAFVLAWAEKQGLFEAWKPLCPYYDQALIFGATTSRMQTRLNYLKQLWESGTRFGQIVWLTGDRPLDNRVDDLTDQCKTELEAARTLWEKASLPEEMRRIPIDFIAAPMRRQKRPDTQNTIASWLEKNPEPCSLLFVSNQPFCGYQYAVVNTSLPMPFEFDVVGPGFNPKNDPNAAAIILDSLARWIYQERD